MANITIKDMAVIESYRDVIAAAMRRAVSLHRDSVMLEVEAFDTARTADAERWAQLTIIKSILSPGAKLDANIALARMLTDALRDGNALHTYDDAETYRAACKYGGRSVGTNIVNALTAWSHVRTNATAAMSWEALATLNNGRALRGHALKTRSWTLALYNAENRVYTLDVHMIRGLARLCNIDRDNVTDAAYNQLASFMLSIHDDVCSELPPLVSQWSLWNEFRHAGMHASHIALAS